MQPPKPNAPDKVGTTPQKSPPVAAARLNPLRRPLAIGIGAALILVCGVTLWAVTREDEPRLNDDTVSIVKFVTGNGYAKLPFTRQAEYMKVLEDRDDNDELEAAFEAGQLSESEYRAGLLEAWLGQQLKRSEKYASFPPGPARDRYIRELLDKKDAKKAKKANKRQPESAQPEVKRDQAQEDIRIAAWPADARVRWEQYRRAYDAQKEAREAAAAPRDVADGK
jgi:hypothetical protein